MSGPMGVRIAADGLGDARPMKLGWMTCARPKKEKTEMIKEKFLRPLFPPIADFGNRWISVTDSSSVAWPAGVRRRRRRGW